MICTCLCVLRMLVATLHLLLCERNSKAPIYVLASVSESTVVSHSLPMVTAIVVWHADAVLASTFDFPAISISLDSLAPVHELPENSKWAIEIVLMNTNGSWTKYVRPRQERNLLWFYQQNDMKLSHSILFLVCCMQNGILPRVVSVRNNNAPKCENCGATAAGPMFGNVAVNRGDSYS